LAVAAIGRASGFRLLALSAASRSFAPVDGFSGLPVPAQGLAASLRPARLPLRSVRQGRARGGDRPGRPRRCLLRKEWLRFGGRIARSRAAARPVAARRLHADIAAGGRFPALLGPPPDARKPPALTVPQGPPFARAGGFRASGGGPSSAGN